MQTTLSITGMQFHAFHGCEPDEQKYGRNYTVDVHFHADVSKACYSDDLHDTIDYVDIYNITKIEMQTPSNLIEHICQRILDKVVAQFPQMTHCHVKLTKHNPPIAGDVSQVSIELEHTK